MLKKKTTKRATKKRSHAKATNGSAAPTITPLVKTCQIQLEAMVDRGGDEPEKGVIRLTYADLDEPTAKRIREIAHREAAKSQQQQG